MHRHVVAVLVMLVVVLVTTHYLTYTTNTWKKKTVTPKRLGAEEGKSVRKQNAGQMLIFSLMSTRKWGTQSLKRPFILHRMFYHAATLGKKECDRTTHWGGGSPPLTRIWRQKFLSWILSIPGCSKWISEASTMTSIS